MKLLPLVVSLFLGLAALSEAAVPQIIQGRVNVGSVNIDGNEPLTFVLVGADGVMAYSSGSNDISSHLAPASSDFCQNSSHEYVPHSLTCTRQLLNGKIGV